MWAYDLTGGLRIGKLHKRVSSDDALAYMPTLPVDRLAAAYIYYDAQADDARLTLTVARTAADYGVAAANYTAARQPRQGCQRPRHVGARVARATPNSRSAPALS